ncbi:type II secretion system F family protein [Dyella agri]|uniref:Type II secretion system F family protein n=2 Tax=Dyella agri TaxID=1926869 RepID=A0ABW8KJL6_9GAMM
MARLEKSLGEPVRAPAAATPAAAPPSEPVPGQGIAQWVDALCLRADLPVGWRTLLSLLLPGVLLAMLGAWRIGTAWAFPLLIVVYAIGLGLWLRARIERQRKRLARQLPDFLDAMVRLASIGNSLPMAFQSSAATVQMPLRAVLDRAIQSARSGMELDRALQLAAQPYRLNELDLLHVVLGTGMRMGGRADHILQRMSDFMRDLDQAQLELRAITSETRMSAWVLGLLPVVVAIFMTLVNPAFFHPMFTEPMGHRLLLMALGLELLGGFLLYRLARSL